MCSTLVILIPGFAKNEEDTTCIPLAQLFIRTLNRNYPAIEVIVITLDFPFTSKTYNWFGNKVIPLNGTRYKFRPLLWIRLYNLLKRLSKEHQLLGLLNFWCADNALVSHYFTRRNKVQHFTWLQGQDARATNKTLRLFKPMAHTLIAISDALKEEFIRNHGCTPHHIVYPGVDRSMFNESKKKDIDIIGVGSLTALKRYHIFIEVVQQLTVDFPAIRTSIVGKGPEEAELQRLIIEKGLQHNIELMGEKDHNTVLELMSRSKIFLHPSSYEGYTIAGLEALAAGCQVVSFVWPERKQVDHWLVAATTSQMIEHCSGILHRPDTSEKGIVLHSIDDTAKQIMELF